MIDYLYSFGLGIFSFTLSGIDDLIILFYFYSKYPKYFNYTILGTFLGLNLIIFISFYLNKIFEIYFQQYIRDIKYIIFAYIIYLIVKAIKELKNNKNKLNLKKKYNVIKIVISSFIIYIINGSDDIIIYTSFLLLNENVLLFIIGINIGLLIWYILIKKYAKQVLKFLYSIYQRR